MTKFSRLLLAGMMAFGLLAFVPATVNAQGANPPCTGNQCAQTGLNQISTAFPTGATTDDIPSIAHKIINWALYLAAIIAVLFIIYGGFLYITSAGDAAQATKGRTALTNALIGLVIVVLSYMLVQVVYNFIAR